MYNASHYIIDMYMRVIHVYTRKYAHRVKTRLFMYVQVTHSFEVEGEPKDADSNELHPKP